MFNWGSGGLAKSKKRRKKRRHKATHHHKRKHHKKKKKKVVKKPTTTATPTTPGFPIDEPVIVPPSGGSLPAGDSGGGGGGGGGDPGPGPGPGPSPEPPGGDPPPKTAVPYPAPNVSVYNGPFDAAQAARLLWRAGFGPGRGDAARLAQGGSVGDAVLSLTRPQGSPTLSGPAPDLGGDPLAPRDAYGHDHLWWLDRMARSSQPLVERMALVWHDWFATSNDKVNDQGHMLDQSDLFRRQGLGPFRSLLHDVTHDPAMLFWLDGIYNDKDSPNENYGREVMELFTLGAGRGAYTEDDVRQMARAFTGWVVDYSDQLGYHNFHYDPDRHDNDQSLPDPGPKKIFGHQERPNEDFDWQTACDLCVDHPLHASFFVRKLWSYFLPEPPSPGTQADLEAIYTSTSGREIRPVLEAILMHPDLYQGPSLVKPPVVLAAGLLRTLGIGITTDAWIYECQDAGQRLFYPPNVSGWNDQRWLDTSTLRGRWELVSESLDDGSFDPYDGSYDADETAAAALQSAIAAWQTPALSDQTLKALTDFSKKAAPTIGTPDERSRLRAMRQNALRQLIAIAPDNQVS